MAPSGPPPPWAAPTAAIPAGLRGALLLARGRAGGMALMPAGGPGVARSFWAAALCLPALVVLRLADWAQAGWPHDGLAGVHVFGLQLAGAAIGWLGFALASRPLARMLGREARWPLFLAAWNWCNVVQALLWVAAVLPALLGAPPAVGQVATVVATGWAFWLEWFAARLALQVGVLPAVAVLALDAALGIATSTVVSLLGG